MKAPSRTLVGDTFELPEFPGVRFDGANDLGEEGTEVFRRTVEGADTKSAEDIERILEAVLSGAGYIPDEMQRIGVQMRRLMAESQPPHDREIFRPKNEEAERLVLDFVDRMLTPESEVIGLEHLAVVMEENRKAAQRVLVFSNHVLELDPVVLVALLDREAANPKNAPIAAVIRVARDKLVAVVGHKVTADAFRRVYGSAVNLLCTVASKYWGSDEVVKQFASNASKLTQHLAQDPNHLTMVFPQGGLTRDNQVGFMSAMGQAAQGARVLPMWIDAPEKLLRVDEPDMITDPSRVRIYMGESFEHKHESSRVEHLVQTWREKLLAVGAPLESHSFGTTKKNGRFRPMQT